MHYAFDRWLTRNHVGNPFERYADDAVIHCDSEDQAQQLLGELTERLESLGLELHPDKTKIVYCKDSNRVGESEHTSFDFLGYTFRARLARGRYGNFVSFAPGISNKAFKAIRKQVRDWHLQRRSGTTLEELAVVVNPQIRGWINYYGAFHYTKFLDRLARHIDSHLVGWAMRKYKRLKGHKTRTAKWVNAARERRPTLFVHWETAPSYRRRATGAV